MKIDYNMFEGFQITVRITLTGKDWDANGSTGNICICKIMIHVMGVWGVGCIY